MVFSNLEFIFIFLPIFFLMYYTIPKKNIVLLIGNLIFYYVGTIENPKHFSLFLICMMFDFKMGQLIHKSKKHRKKILAFSILINTACLVVCKYFSFIVMPVGISFYIFQSISYLIDVYRGKTEAEESLLEYAVYISMFEQLIAGPIVTYSQVKKQLHKRQLTKKRIMNGMITFTYGLGFKVLLANPLGKMWGQVEAIGYDSISTMLAWMAIIAFTMQIYFDFYGYSLMAMGLGEMLGFKLPKNFDYPYLSKTMTEFWRRWHMTLGSWFREYVYIPLGGNKKGKICHIINLFIVWMLTGIWHGAGYNFALWGFLLFVVIAVEKYFTGRYLQKTKIMAHIYMAFLIPVTWSVFAITDMEKLKVFLLRLFPVIKQNTEYVFEKDYIKYMENYGLFFIAGIILLARWPYKTIKREKNKKIKWCLATGVFVASVYCISKGFDDPFLYYRF